MLTVIYGGSGSGKSEVAENTAVKLNSNRIYIATMQPFGEEENKKIACHREMRKSKNFKTIECYRDLHKINIEKDCVVLVECISNLTANEFFGGERENAADKIIKGILRLNEKCSDVIVVTNNVFEDGIEYDEETVKYMQCLGEINRQLSETAKRVTEVVCGIEILIKDEIV